jgi:hypothetical protein
MYTLDSGQNFLSSNWIMQSEDNILLHAQILAEGLWLSN